MNAFILGMPLPKDSEILTTDVEYQAVLNTVQFRCHRDGLIMRQARLSIHELGSTPEALARVLLDQIGPLTRMLVISHVVTGNGATLPLEMIAKETRSRGILLVVDGAHATGFLDLNFAKLDDVDFYGGNFHKWMMGPKGTGYGWVNKRHQSALTPLLAGWNTFEAGPPFDRFGGGQRFPTRFLMNGCHDFAPFFALADMLDFWKKHGAQDIRTRVRELQSTVEREVARRVGWVPVSPPAGVLRGPLLAYHLPTKLEDKGYWLLKDVHDRFGVQVAMTKFKGRWCMRFSPHIHIEEEDIDKAALGLQKL